MLNKVGPYDDVENNKPRHLPMVVGSGLRTTLDCPEIMRNEVMITYSINL